MIDQTLFKKHFVGRDGFQWWIGQIPPEESWRENKTGKRDASNTAAKGFGERYRVRIMGYHTANADDIPDDELPWAYVMYPVTAGGGGRGSSQNANLTQGTFVFGWFMDGEDAQLPIIMGVLGHNNYTAVMKEITPTRFIPFDGYPAQDPVHGSDRSTLQVREGANDQVTPQDNASGQVVNSQYTSSAEGDTSVKVKADAPPEPKDPILATSECDKAPTSAMVLELTNVMKEIQRINQMIYDAQAGFNEDVAEVQEWIAKKVEEATEYVSGIMKWIFTEIEKFVLNKLNFVIRNTFSIIPPDLKETLRLAVESSNDIIACLFKRLIGELPGMIGGFLGDLFGALTSGGSINIGLGIPTKAVNLPQCFLENFIGATLGNIVNVIANTINDAFDAVTGIVGEVAGIVGDVISFIESIISFLNCEVKGKCPKVKEWSITSGAGDDFVTDLGDLIDGAKGIASSVAGLGNQIGDLGNLANIDFSDVFDSSACDLGPRSCGPPTVGYVGDGGGAQLNLVISGEGGEIMGVDIISSGFGFSQGNSYLTVNDDCGIGQGGVLEPVFGNVVPVPLFDIGGGDLPDDIIVRPEYVYVPAPDNYNTGLIGNFTGDITAGSNTINNIKPQSILERLMPGATIRLIGGGSNVKLTGTAKVTAFGSLILDRTFVGTGEAFGASFSASGTVTQTGIVDVIVKEPGYGYLPSPNGSSGGGGAVWAPADYTIIVGDGSFNPGNGSTSSESFGTDYYPPIPPGNTVPIPAGATVTTPPNSNMTEGSDNEGNGVEILPGSPLVFPNGGSMTSPTIMQDIDITAALYPSTSSYPVIMYLCELIVDKPGVDYQPTDEVVIEPDMGATATPKFDKFGRLLSIKVTAGGEGFKQIPEVYIKTKTGFGSKITPKFCIDRLGEDDLEREPGLQDKVLSVVDCVGAV